MKRRGHQRGASGSPSPGTVDTQSLQCATTQHLETLQVHLGNEILQVENDMVQFQETNQLTVDNVKGKQRHRNVDLRASVEKVRTTLNQKVQRVEKTVETQQYSHLRKTARLDAQEKLRHYESELLTTRERNIQEKKHTKHTAPDDANRGIQKIKDELDRANEVLEQLKDQFETSSAENAGEFQALTEESERLKNNHPEAWERHTRGVKDPMEN